MTFIKKVKEDSIENLYITIGDIDTESGTFLKGTVLKLVKDKHREYDFIDCEGNTLIESSFYAKFIVPLSKAHMLFGTKKR